MQAGLIIGQHLSIPPKSVSQYRFKGKQYKTPSIYEINNSFWCAPKMNQIPPQGWIWKRSGYFWGRSIFVATEYDTEEC